MNKWMLAASMAAIGLALFGGPVFAFETDTFPTTKGDLKITFIGHGTLMLEWDKKVIHVDPWTKLADYGTLPKADLVLITHDHRDHLDAEAIKAIKKDHTVVAANALSQSQLGFGDVMANGQSRDVMGIAIEAAAAYNLVHKRPEGQPFHPKGEGNGYILNLGGFRVYIAGDTENTPEMKALKNIDAAFLPMNLPYTMTPDMVADAAKAFRPKVLYPYHTGETDLTQLTALMAGEKDIDVRIRPLK
jgi:L-ascorbate metabolism protein UlaG (beta-lactamase superfamily)